MFSTWQQVPLKASWGRVEPGAVLLFTDDEAVVVDARRSPQERSKVRLRIQRPNGERFERDVKSGETLRGFTAVSGPLSYERGGVVVWVATS